MTVRYILLSILLLTLLAGCTQNLTNGYFWGNYSKTQYAYLKNPSPDTLSEHINTLQNIVKVSNNRKLRIPPGVLIELAMLSRVQDPGADISAYLDQEMTIYPEAAHFVQFVNANLLAGFPDEEEDNEAQE